MRSAYAGSYSGNIEIQAFQANLPTTIVASDRGSNAADQTMMLTVVTGVNETTEITLETSLTSNTMLEVPSTKVDFTLIPGETEAFISGTGTYKGDSLIANITIQGAVNGFTADAVYKGMK